MTVLRRLQVYVMLSLFQKVTHLLWLFLFSLLLFFASNRNASRFRYPPPCLSTIGSISHVYLLMALPPP